MVTAAAEGYLATPGKTAAWTRSGSPAGALEVGQRALGLEEADACYFEDFGF